MSTVSETGKKCRICGQGGSVHRTRLVPLTLLRRSMLAGSTREQFNWIHFCKPCERAFRCFQGISKPDETTAAIVILHRPKIEDLLVRASAVRDAMLDGQFHEPFGKVVARAAFQAGLEGF